MKVYITRPVEWPWVKLLDVQCWVENSGLLSGYRSPWFRIFGTCFPKSDPSPKYIPQNMYIWLDSIRLALYLNKVSFDMKCRVAGFGLLLVYVPAHELEYLGPVSPNCPLKCSNYPKEASTKNFCYALQILAVKRLGGLRESIN